MHHLILRTISKSIAEAFRLKARRLTLPDLSPSVLSYTQSSPKSHPGTMRHSGAL